MIGALGCTDWNADNVDDNIFFFFKNKLFEKEPSRCLAGDIFRCRARDGRQWPSLSRAVPERTAPGLSGRCRRQQEQLKYYYVITSGARTLAVVAIVICLNFKPCEKPAAWEKRRPLPER